MERSKPEPEAYSRRDFLATGVSACGLAPALAPNASPAAPAGNEPAGKSTMLQADYRKLVSRADLDYEKPARRSEEGMPVGNGRMGSLVWTSPSALKFQINRVDVFAMNRSTNSFPERHTDYSSGCGYVDIDFVDFGQDVFTGPAFHQHLSVYDALMTARGQGVSARLLAWHQRDVMAVEIDDQRPQPAPINIDLRMLRYAIQYHERQNWELTSRHAVMVRTRSHTAASKLDIRNSRIILTQEFRENDYYDASAVAIAVVGRKAKAKYVNESTVRLSAAPGKGRFTILIASAASFDPKQDVAGLALEELEAAAAKGFDALLAGNQAWWHDFWSRAFVHLRSADGAAENIERAYAYFLYLMGSSSRGAYPPRFGGMIWYTTGDMRAWGAQHWWANTSSYYNNLAPANRLELLDPVFSMYSGMYESCALAARQQWGSQGIWIPETTWFDGLEKLPDDIAEEMRDLYLVRKPWEQRSARFREFAETGHPHNSRWSWIDKGKWINGRWVWGDKKAGAFGHTSHMMSVASKIALVFWQRYECTLDRAWLRDRAYPMLKGAAEFYRNFPNVKKADDGKYHIYHVNNVESNWNSADTPDELSAMHRVFPVVIRAAEILDADAGLRPLWREFVENLTPAPARGAGRAGGFSVVTGGLSGGDFKASIQSHLQDINPEKTYIDWIGLGQMGILWNRLRLREGPGAIDAEHLGAMSGRLHTALLDSAPEAPAGEPVLRVFSNWPEDWDAEYTLLARGGFLVTSAARKGRVEFVELRSQAGAECRLNNPWGAEAVELYRNGKKAETLSGPLMKFDTAKDEVLVVVPKGAAPDKLKRTVPVVPLASRQRYKNGVVQYRGCAYGESKHCRPLAPSDGTAEPGIRAD